MGPVKGEPVGVRAEAIVTEPVFVRVVPLRGIEGEGVKGVLSTVAVGVDPLLGVVGESITGVGITVSVGIDAAEAVGCRVAGRGRARIAASATGVVAVTVAVAVHLLGGVKLESVVIHALNVVAVAVAIKVVPLRRFKRQVVNLVSVAVTVGVGATQYVQRAVARRGGATVAVHAQRVVTVTVVVAVLPLGGVAGEAVVGVGKAVEVHVQAATPVPR